MNGIVLDRSEGEYLPGVVSMLVGILFEVRMLQIYAAEHYIVTNIIVTNIRWHL